MKKEKIIDKLCNSWEGFNKNTLEKVFNEEKTILSVAMLSLYRTKMLLSMMNHWESNRFIKTNMSLRVQGLEKIDKNTKNTIERYLKEKFDKFKIFYNEGNIGTGIPRHEMVHEALKFNTPYIMTTDDDMFFPEGSIEAQISILEDNPEIGAVDIWCAPNLNAWEIDKNRMIYRQPIPLLDYVDGMGSATMVIRREVFETCDLDPNYFIGWGDIDFCMQMRKAGWKLAILAIPGYKAINNNIDNTKEYIKYRYNPYYAEKSRERFYEKWGKKI